METVEDQEEEIEAAFVEAEVVHLAVVVEVDSATEEAEVEDEEHQEVVAPLEEAAVEVQEVAANSVRKEAQKPLSNHIGIQAYSLLVGKRICWSQRTLHQAKASTERRGYQWNQAQ